MPGINGIFEPFKKYVQDQLTKRQKIVKERKSQEFFSYTTNKTCYLRMVSGVNIAKKNNILDSSETPQKLDEGLAKQYILEGGTLYYDRLDEGAMRESFTEGKKESKKRGFTYGDDHVRADAGDNFGIVPMPGITDVEIRTRTPEGSLREAKINFECHNRRQLQVLEALYMRPGYPVLLEWGWSPYIHSIDGLETNPSLGIARKFLDPTKVNDTTSNLFNLLNMEIIKKKKDTEGNYDGFIGIIKNFQYSSKPDGGYKCTTELIAQGEILESLRSKKKFIETDSFKIVEFKGNNKGSESTLGLGGGLGTDIGREVEVVKTRRNEILDNFLLYLKSIKALWDKTGDEAYLQLKGTDGEKSSSTSRSGPYSNVISVDEDAIKYLDLQEVSPKYEEAYDEIIKLIKDIGKDIPLAPSEVIDTVDPTNFTWENGWWECLDPLSSPITGFGTGKTTQPTEALWKACIGPKEGGVEGIDFRSDSSQGGAYAAGPDGPNNPQADEWKKFEGEYAGPPNRTYALSSAKKIFKYGAKTKIMAETFKKDTDYNSQSSGLLPFHGGLIVQQISKYVSNNEEINSGYRKNIFVRWDLICQMFNHLCVDKVGPDGNEPITEMTYLAPNQQTYDLSKNEKIDNTDSGDDKNKNQLKEYIRYTPPQERPTIPGELVYNDEEYITNKETALIGSSLNENIGLMPHQEITKAIYRGINPGGGMTDIPEILNKETIYIYPEQPIGAQQFTSYSKAAFNEFSVGAVLFNIDYLIRTYEEISTTKRESTQTQKVKPTINFNKYFNTIWEGINEATGYYYDFGLHVEHERPHVSRIIDFHYSGVTRKNDLFTFKPQLDGSIVRDFNFNSEIPSDMASVISIAAQAPNNINDLDALSFKAFHKGIYSRFSTTPLTSEELTLEKLELKNVLVEDVKNYKNLLISLREYTIMFNNSSFSKINSGEKTEKGEIIYKTPLTAEKAITYVEDLEELRISIENRYPLYKQGGKEDHPDAGLSRPNTTYHRSSIIPLKYNIQLDGIAGITPLTLFRVHKDVLPIGYQSDNVIFIVKEEIQKISSGQDWTTEFSGQLTLQDDNPNFTGQNLSDDEQGTYFSSIDEEIKKITEIKPKPIDGAMFASISTKKPSTLFVDPIDPAVSVSMGDGYPFRRGTGRLHTGIDIPANIGINLIASRDGTVSLKEQGCNYSSAEEKAIHCKGGYGGWGKYIVLTFDETDPDTYASKALYAHCDSFEVTDGATVKAGGIIGTVGETGNTTGPHLHYEIGTEKFLTSEYPSSGDREGRITDRYGSPQRHFLLNPELFVSY